MEKDFRNPNCRRHRVIGQLKVRMRLHEHYYNNLNTF